jgi:DNA-directed RNA polymerase subunit K/omega
MENFEDSKVDSKFRFILLAARRAEQVMRGARPKLHYRTPKVAREAMDEILADAVAWDYSQHPVPECIGEVTAETPGAEGVEGEMA